MADALQDATTPQPAMRRTLTLPIKGMHCAACVTTVERALSGVAGVASATVNLATERAQVTLDVGWADLAALSGAVASVGYDVRRSSHVFEIEGMTCATCVGRVERALRSVEGVISATVNLASGEARVIALDGQFDPARAVAAVAKAGYHARLKRTAVGRASEWRARLESGSVVLALVLSLPLVAEMIAHMAGSHFALPWWLALGLATIVQFGFGASFYRAGFAALRHGTGNMDLLVALGTSAAFGYSVAQLIQPFGDGARYFEASTLVIALVRLGRWLEARAKRRAGATLRALYALRPDQATVERDGKAVFVPLAELQVKDIVIVRPGERVPVDGTIVEGTSELDESLVTGESLPVTRDVGARVAAGSMNGTGLLKIEMMALGAESTIARIARAVERAQASKPAIQRLVDRISAIFVPIVLGIAIVTVLAWGLGVGNWTMGFVSAVSVLVIACPCALGLATPAALVAGTAAAARRGVLLRDSEAIEQARRIDTIVFDKTGTLTIGRPSVVACIPHGISEQELLSLAAAVQMGSEHPLGRAIAAAAAAKGITPPRARLFRVKPGRGVSATAAHGSLLVGSRRFVEESGVETAVLVQQADRLEAEGRTVVWVAELAPSPRVLGLIACADQVRDAAPVALARLKARGFRLVLITGDNASSAHRVARALGIDEVHAGVLPEAKSAEILALRDSGRRVAMVGDGINDAPALAAADLGIAIGSGTDVAMETAAITLMRSDLALVEEAIDIARATRRKITENLVWAFSYNVVALPLAAAGLLGPLIAGAAMAFSSVSVVSNALLLLRRPNRIRA